MLGTTRRERANRGPRIPQARVVRGRQAPSWAHQQWRTAPAIAASTTYERVRAGREGVLATVFGFWPLIAIMSMGIALVWSASVWSGP